MSISDIGSISSYDAWKLSYPEYYDDEDDIEEEEDDDWNDDQEDWEGDDP